MKISTKSKEPITLGDTNIEKVPDFMYLGSRITLDGDSRADHDVLALISKATGTYAALRPIWKSVKIDRNTKAVFSRVVCLGPPIWC